MPQHDREQDLRIGATLANLLWTLQGRSHDVLSTGHHRMLRCRDETPPPARDADSEAQGREHLEQQLRIQLHPGILHAAPCGLGERGSGLLGEWRTAAKQPKQHEDDDDTNGFHPPVAP